MDSPNALFLDCKRFKLFFMYCNSGKAPRSWFYVTCLNRGYTGCQLIRGLSIRCCCIHIRHCMTWHWGIFVNWLCRMCHVVLKSTELNLLTASPEKPGKYGSRSFSRVSVNLWNSPKGRRADWLKNCPTLGSFKRNLKTLLFWERCSS